MGIDATREWTPNDGVNSEGGGVFFRSQSQIRRGPNWEKEARANNAISFAGNSLKLARDPTAIKTGAGGVGGVGRHRRKRGTTLSPAKLMMVHGSEENGVLTCILFRFGFIFSVVI
ncbi:hypothetical protein GWI33_006523 [Rhynchophorus ferrugineus]|uniref:Uncharacterized protein n=1 Tax=Rhynchophorus ferrugineus TaxID=354439 RepID=A0A834IEW2_RHYFE|nr:hypothetical protein GWI33_006523 [Rhynchophorus ferrugineus]